MDTHLSVARYALMALLGLMLLVSAATVWADDAAHVRLTTEAAMIQPCSFLATVSDNEVKDLRKKIARAGGDTGLLSFDDGNTIVARAFRCPNGQGVPPPLIAPAPPPPATTLSGTFSGGISGNSKRQHWTMDVVFTLVQSGVQLTGLWNTTGGTSGGVTGVLAESGIPGLKIKQVNPCAGEFVGVAVVEAGGNRLRGSYVGDDCSGQVTGSFVVNRQAPSSASASPERQSAATAVQAPATASNRATAEWECRRDVETLVAESTSTNHRYVVGPPWFALWQGHERDQKIQESRALLFDSCMRAKGF